MKTILCSLFGHKPIMEGDSSIITGFRGDGAIITACGRCGMPIVSKCWIASESLRKDVFKSRDVRIKQEMEGSHFFKGCFDIGNQPFPECGEGNTHTGTISIEWVEQPS